MAKIVRKAIAFNLDDPFQRELYEFAKRNKNFSYYGKRLIEKDMERWEDRMRDKGGIRVRL